MPTRRRAIATFLLAGLLALQLPAASPVASMRQPYDRLYVFGDSYSDSGAGLRSTNGETAVERLADRLGAGFTHARDPRANATGINFAVAGASTGAHAGREIGGRWLLVGMQNQVDDFVSRVREGAVHFDPEATLFFIAGGLNDAGLPTEATITHLTRQVEQLHGVGARHVSLALLPTRIPAFAEQGRRLNPAYRALVPVLRRRLGIDVRLNRFGPYLDAVHAHPRRYGITEVTGACAANPVFDPPMATCADPARHFYYYSDHPSAVVNRVVGDRLYAEIAGSAADQPASRSQRAASSAK